MPIVVLSATIPAGQSISAPVDFGAGELLRLYMPQAWTPAVLTFQMSPDNILPYADVFYPAGGGREFQINITPGGVIIVGLEWRALAWMKFRSGLRAQPVAQVADRDIKLVIVR
jgi:hypothetical protein